MSDSGCPFCNLPIERVVRSNDFGIVIRDGYPVSHGHTLIIPRKHIASFFDLLPEEQAGLFELLVSEQKILKYKYNPQSFNIGINDGVEAGQTVPHLHIHLIPRYLGDVQDPRGGVRWVLPDKAIYWK